MCSQINVCLLSVYYISHIRLYLSVDNADYPILS